MLSKLWRRLFVLPALGSGQSDPVVSGNRKPLGYQQVTCGNTAAALTFAALTAGQAGSNINFLIIENQDASINVRWRDDGTAPTATVGMRILAGQQLVYAGDPYAIQFIAESGSPKINVSAYA